MRSRLLAATATIAALALSGGVLASVIKGSEPVAPTAGQKRLAEGRVYERIVTDDPDARAEIQRLYAEDREHQRSTLEKLAAVEARMRDAEGWEARKAIAAEARALKESLELRHIEIGLRIAELNGDEHRAESFARALDERRNPEKYRRELADPSIEAERRRELGQ